jgi:hypothetical protein
MQHISRFLSDNFLDSYEQEEDRKVIASRRKKEMEEKKFYDELERQDIDKKNGNNENYRMSSPRNRKANSFNSSSQFKDQGRQDENTMSKYDSERSLSDNVLMSTIVAKDKEIAAKDKEISRLERELKTNTNAKAYAMRFAKFEKAKEGEIEDIKSHYKSMMENLAKQIQKANDRHDEEIKKNTKLRETMDEMRNDMANREQDLEDKILALGKLVKEGNNVKDKLQKKIEHLETTSVESEKKVQQANLSQREYADRMKILEDEFELERKEMMESFQAEKKSLHDKLRQDEHSLRDSKSSLKKQLSDTMNKLEDEEQKHEESITRLQRAERSILEKERKIKDLEFKLNEVETESDDYRKRVEKDMQTFERWKRNKSLESKDQNSIHVSQKLNLLAELKEVNSKLETAQKKIVLLEDLVKQKTGALRRKTDEMEALQNQLKFANDRSSKDTRQRDIIAVKDKRKLESSEAALRKELEDIKASPEYIRMIELSKKTKVPDNLEHASVEELLEAIQKLKAEKSSLELKMSLVTLRHEKEMNESQKQLNVTLKKDNLYSDASKKKSSDEAKGGVTGIAAGYKSRIEQNTSHALNSNSSTSDQLDLAPKTSTYRPSSRRSSTPVKSRALSQVKSKRSIFSNSE